MALDFQSTVTKDQKQILSDFADEEIAKATRKKKRLDFLASKMASYRDALAGLQEDADEEYLASTTAETSGKTPENFLPPVIKEKTLEGFKRQTAQVENGVPWTPTNTSTNFTRPIVSASVDDVKTPLLESIKGRFERLEYAIRRAADRTEVLEQRSEKQSSLSADVAEALKKVVTED